MSTLILRTAGRPIIVLMLAFAIYLLLRGHNLPGGGFVAGLAAAIAAILADYAYGRKALLAAAPIDPRVIVMIGIAATLLSGFISAFAGVPFLTGLWTPGLPLGTPLLFDVGVFLVVVGAVVTLVTTLEAEEEED